MSVAVNVRCNSCGYNYSVTLKRYNESHKNNWKLYCSPGCLKSARYKRACLICSNPACEKTFHRSSSEISKNNFCSSSCAARVNNRGRKRVKFCANLSCRKQIPSRNTYCSNKCEGAVLRKSLEYYRGEVLRRIQNFVKRNERIPLKKELGSAYQLARKGFGTWNDAIRAAGFDPNPVMFANKHMAKDGHKCDSLAERIVDDWLYSKGINHQINVCYPGQKKLTADFVVGNVWIEYFGLAGQLITYDVCMKKKFGLSKKLGFKLVQVFPYHIFPKNTLDQQLCMLLTSLSPATIFIAALGRFNVNSVFSGLGHTPSS